jgi:hypothetical protein
VTVQSSSFLLHAVEVALVTLLGVWLLITILHQPRWISPHLPRWLAALSAIPVWRFFAPNPSTSDFDLLYRDRYDNSALTAVTHAALQDSRRLTHLLWNPSKRRAKVLSDCMRALNDIANAQPESDLSRTIPYMVLANYVMSLPPRREGSHRQYLVVRRRHLNGEHHLKILLQSRFHQPTSGAVRE